MTEPRLALLLLCIGFFVSACNPVVNFFAFHPDTSYTVPTDKLPPDTKEVFMQASDDVRVHALYLNHSAATTLTIYFHGNAGNVYHRLRDFQRLREIGTSVLSVSYRGYGKSGGSPAEKGLYLDAGAAYAYATETLGYKQSKIFLFGRSLGSTAATDLAQGKPLAGVILISPLSSAADQADAMGLGFAAGLTGDAFDNLAKIAWLEAPLLIVHGTLDRIIPLTMGRKVYENAPDAKFFRPIEGASHNDLSSRYARQYWEAIAAFMNRTKKASPNARQ